jgi:cell division protein FtsB
MSLKRSLCFFRILKKEQIFQEFCSFKESKLFCLKIVEVTDKRRFLKMRRFKVRYIIFIIAIPALLVLTFNEGSRTLVRRFFEQNKLKKDIENARAENDLLKNRIYYLENEPSYLERMVRSELKVVSTGEIEYRFSFKNQE